jgi:peptide/nickel transport system substrate-binding protein
MIDLQSQELDPKKRLAMVADIQRKLEEDGARPTIAWRLEYYLQWQHVKNLIPHQSIYNWGRMQEVWLDR